MPRTPTRSSGLFTGLVLLSVGFLLLLHNYGHLDLHDFLSRWWPLLIVFWATWASPVKNDLPELAKLYEKNRGKGFAVLGVNLDNERKDVDAFLKATPLPW